MTALGCEVEGLSLDTGRVHNVPFQVVLLELGVLRLVLGHRLDGIGSMLWLSCTGDIGKPGKNQRLLVDELLPGKVGQ